MQLTNGSFRLPLHKGVLKNDHRLPLDTTGKPTSSPGDSTLGISFILGRKFTVFLCFTLYLRAISKYKPPGGLIFGGFFALRVWGAYFRIFTVCILFCDILCSYVFLGDLD